MKDRKLRSYSCERTLTTLGFADAASVSPDGDFVLLQRSVCAKEMMEMVVFMPFHACSLSVSYLRIHVLIILNHLRSAKESSLHSVDVVAADKGDPWAYHAFESLAQAHSK